MMKRSIFITIISLVISIATIGPLHSQTSVIDSVIYFSEDGDIILAFSDGGQASFISIKNNKLLIGTYTIGNNGHHILFLAQSNDGVVYAENKFEILSNDIIQDINSSALFYKNQ